MGATYTRQSTFTDGDVIDSDLFNNEFDQILAAFASSTGHTHDGTAGEGGPVTGLITDGIVFGTNTGDITLTWNAGSNDGVIIWKEDEDYFEFSDDLRIAEDEKIEFRDTAIYINSSADGQLDLVADTEIQIAATTIDINGNVDVSGTLTVAGAVDFGDAALSNVGAVQLDSISGDGDTNTSITFSGSDVITVANAGTNQVTFNDGSIAPVTDSDVDLGTNSLRFKDVYIDSATVTGEVAAASLDISGNIDVDGVTNLDVVDIDGAVDMASTLAVAGVLTGASLDISGDIDIDGTANLDVVDIDGAVDMATTLTVGGEITAASLDISGNVDIDGTLETDALSINSTTVTSTAAELNILDGVTASAADINLIDGITNGTVIASKAIITDANKDITGGRNITISGELDAATLDISGDADIDGTLEADAITIGGVTLAETISDTVGGMVTSNTESGITVTYDDSDNTLDFTVGTLNQDTTGTAAIATTVTITDNENTNENNAIVFTSGGDLDGGNIGLESDGDLKYNPSTGTLSATNISVSGTLSTVDSVTMSANNAVVFEGATADAHETTLTIVDATADRTITLPNVSGTVPVLAAASNTQVTSTPEELNILDGVTSTAAELNILDGVTSTAAELNILDGVTSTAAELNILDGVTASATDLNLIDGITNGTVIASKAIITDSNKDITGGRNVTISGELDAATLDISGNGDVAGTLAVSGGSSNGVEISQGAIAIKNGGSQSYIDFYCESSNAHYARIQAPAHSAFSGNATITLPSATTTLASTNLAETLTNKTLTSPKINEDVAVTSTATELNLLDGVTSTTAELNILDGVTSTAAELNALAGITAVVGELNALDIGSTAVGTAVASKAVILDSNKDYTGVRNFTLSGELDAGSLDISGNVDIDGTLETDALSINSTAVTSTAAELNILDGVTSTAAELNILDGVTSTAAELNILDVNNSTIGDLTEISTVANDDVFLAVDASGGGLKKLTRSTIISGLALADAGLANIVEDTTPQLGGNLDTNSHNILIDDAHFIGDESGNEQIVFQTTGSAVNHLEITNNASGSNPILAAAGGDTNIGIALTPKGTGEIVIAAGNLNYAGTAITSTGAELNILDGVTSTAAELNILDGATVVVGEINALDLGSTAVGTAIASKAVILDSNKDYTGMRNLTVSGELDAATGDFSGDVDIDGTLETDALSLNGTAVTSTAAELNILDGVTSTAAELNILDGVTSTAAELNILAGVTSTAAELNILDGVTSTAAELNILDGVTTTAAEINLIDGGTSRGTTAVADGDGVLINDGGTMRMTKVDTLSTYMAGKSVGGGNIVTTGALNSGTITSGFGTIDTGSSAITTTGLISGGSLDIDNVLINGTTIGHTDDTDLMTVANGLLTVAGEVQMTTLDIGGTNVTSTAAELNILDGVTSTAAELNALDGITAVVGELNALDIGSTAVGTAVASKAVILDSSKDYTGIRNFTITGDLVVGGTTTVVDTVTMNAENAVVFEGATADDNETTLTIIDPNAARTIKLPNQSGTIPVLAAESSTAITSTPDELNILDGVTSTAAELNILDGVTTTAAEINLIDGGTARGTTAVADGDGILINDAGTMRMTTVQTVSAYMAAESVGGGNIVTTGALNSGTITSGFGNIDNGSSTITTTGAVATGAITAGGILKTDDTTAATSTTDGSLQTDGGLSVAGDAVIGDDVKLLSDAAVLSFGANSEVTLTHVHNDGLLLNTDMQLQFRDSAINIRSDADGDLDINADDEIELNSTLIDINGNVDISGTTVSAGKITADAGIDIDNFNIDGTTIALSSGDMTLDAAGDIILDADGAQVRFKDAGTERFVFNLDATPELDVKGGNFTIHTNTSDADMIFTGNDGGSTITALTLDMSAAGKAAFNKGATFGASVTAQTDTDTSNSGSVTLDYAANQNFVLTMTGNVTLANPTTEVVGQSGFISFIQDGTGSRVLSVGNQYFCAGGSVIVLSTAANSIDIVPYVVVAAGKICLGAPQLAFADAS